MQQQTAHTFKNIPKPNEDIKKIEFKPKAEKKSFKIGWKVKTALVVSIIILILIGIYAILRTVSNFFDNNKVVFHQVIKIELNPPFTIEKRELLISPVVEATPSATPSPTPEPTSQGFHLIPSAMAQEVREIDYKNLAQFIHFRESNSGTAPKGHHVTCRNKGLWNEIGYAPQQGFCFESEEAGMAKLDSWLKENVSALGISKSLCKYNSGKALADCQYYQDYLAYTLK